MNKSLLLKPECVKLLLKQYWGFRFLILRLNCPFGLGQQEYLKWVKLHVKQSKRLQKSNEMSVNSCIEHLSDFFNVSQNTIRKWW